MEQKPRTLVKVYEGKTPEAAAQLFQLDAAILEKDGYRPTSQVWIPGSRGCGSFLLAAFLVVLVIGLIVLVYYLMVKPPGRLTVTYELRE
jgi:hypothetical protein